MRAIEADILQPFVWSTDLLQSSNGDVLLATPGGALRVHDRKAEPLDDMAKAPDNQALCLLESREGSLWIGTKSTGLLHRDRLGKWNRFDLGDGLASRVVQTLHEDARGWLWVGTSDGVNLFRDGLWSRLGEHEGLAGLDVRHIRSEPDGSIWIATDGGLTRYFPTRAAPHAAWRDAANQPTTGTLGPVIRGLVGQHIDFAVEAAKGNRLRWRIREDGHLGSWNELHDSHEWGWMPTHAGRMTIEAQVVDRDLNLSETLARDVHVQIEWHRRTAVRSLAMLLGLGVVGGLAHLGLTLQRQRRESVRFKEEARQLEAVDHTRMEFERRLIRTQEAERSRIARELHDSLGQELLLIRTSALLARRSATATETDPVLSDIADRASRSIEEVRTIAYALRPQELDRYGMAAAMKALCDDLASVGMPRIEFHADPGIPVLGSEVEIGLFRILQECLTNALKHAGAACVQCRLTPRDLGAELQVSDDGCGFDPTTVVTRESSGLGLSGMRERVRLLGGRFHVESRPGHGTTVTAWIPATPLHSDRTSKLA